MLELKNDINNIQQFIIAGLEKFTSEVNGPSVMGVYCCPWSGWISLNFNISRSLNGEDYNCLDFEFVEFDIIEFNNWQEEYDSFEGVWVDENSKIYNFNLDDGDEGLNGFFYRFLKDLLINLNKEYKLPSTVLQFLDSKFHAKII